jgi:putative addiction module component (TIGR02574 family)
MFLYVDNLFRTGYYLAMSKVEILQELPKLTAEDRQEIRQKLNEIDGDEWLDADDPLTEAEKALLDVRLAAYKREPDEGTSWKEVEARIQSRING